MPADLKHFHAFRDELVIDNGIKRFENSGSTKLNTRLCQILLKGH